MASGRGLGGLAGQTALAAFGLLLVGCSPSLSTSGPSSESPQTGDEETTAPSTTTPPTMSEESTAPDQHDADVDAELSDCVRLTDFSTLAEQRAVQTVNDNVMGGRSRGGPTFSDGRVVFAGEINTDGGGFSSLRLPLEPKTLSPFGKVRFRARPDERDYMVTFDDSVRARDRRVSHRAPIEFGSAGEWQTVSVEFTQLTPAIFGRPIDDLPFDKDLATRLGIMISDGQDGPFRLEIDWIDLCP